MVTAMNSSPTRPQVLFVDDEKRVLNSMRVMFRREYDLHLASSGAEALEIIRTRPIDVIVADHRMPQMTGVQLLSQARTLSPRTVRILLTGYADLDAVEGSINDGEVFRFLTKPCPPDHLRETVALATHVAKCSAGRPPPASAPAPQPALPDADDAENADTLPINGAAAATVAAPPAPAPARPAPSRQRLAQGLAVVVFTNDQDVLTTVQKAVRGRIPVHAATNIVQVVKILNERKPGVLLTDISEDKATIQTMTARLKEDLPELVTIAVSPHRDVLDMVWLINHGQIFRFLRKPLTPSRCAVSLQAALKHHRMLLRHPELVQRHQVETTEDVGIMGNVMARLKNMRRLWTSG